MKKNYFFGKILTANALLGIILSLAIVLPAFADSNRGRRGGDNRGDDEKEIRLEVKGLKNSSRGEREIGVNMNFENKVGSAISGIAKIDVFLTRDNLHDARIKINIKNISATNTSVFEGWLVDNDSGYKLSLGGFKMKEEGKAALDFKQLMVNFNIYDKLIVSQEPVNDANPGQSTVILETNLNGIEIPPPAPMPIIVTSSVLNGANEIPATTTPATGFGVFTINTNNNTVNFHIAFSGLASAETAAHIHGFALQGVNAPVLFTLPLGSPKNGVWNYLESQEADILAGKTYVNIHSTTHPDGEIRGQIKP